MRTIQIKAGATIEEAAVQLAEAAQAELDGCAQANFNGYVVETRLGLTPGDIVAAYERQVEEKIRAYDASPEGQKAARHRKQEREETQRLHDTLMAQLPNLPFDDVSVLNWLHAMQTYSDRNDLTKQPQVIIDWFATHECYPKQNGDSHLSEDREKAARYIMGQALHFLNKYGDMHGIIRSDINDWKKKFLSPTT